MHYEISEGMNNTYSNLFSSSPLLPLRVNRVLSLWYYNFFLHVYIYMYNTVLRIVPGRECPTAMRPAFRPSQWHGHLVVRSLRTPTARTAVQNAERHQHHSPVGQSAVLVPTAMHRWEHLFRVVIDLYGRRELLCNAHSHDLVLAGQEKQKYRFRSRNVLDSSITYPLDCTHTIFLHILAVSRFTTYWCVCVFFLNI